MADAVIAPSATTRLRYQFTVDGVVSAVPTVTATETEPDGTINNLSNPTLQNSGTDPSYILDYSNADEGDYYVKFLTSDTNCDQYPGVAFYVNKRLRFAHVGGMAEHLHVGRGVTEADELT